MMALITPAVRHSYYGLALSITKQPGVAEVILEDSIVKVLERGDLTKNFLGYLYMTVRNNAQDWYNKWRRQQQYIARNVDAAVTTRTSFAEAISREAMKLFDKVISKMSRKQRRVVILRVIHLLSFEEIEKKTKIKKGAARQIFFRAKIHLEEWVEYLRA